MNMNPTRTPTVRLTAGIGRRGSGFTLIELLTVIAIIGILAAIVIPTTARVRKSARATQCLSNLRQIASASQMFAEESKGLFPDGDVPGQSGFYVTQMMRFELIAWLPRKANDDVWFCPGQPKPVSLYYYPNRNSLGARLSTIPAPARFILWRDRAEDPAVNVDTDVTPGAYGPHERIFNVCFADGHVGKIADRQELVDLLAQPAK